MMKEWQIRQEIYHRLHRNHEDDLSTQDIQITENVVEDAVRYFKEQNIGWIYPAKSYMVSICYAKWLSEEFGGEPMEYLNDPNLLFGNDPYFVEYDKDPQTYENILKIIGWNFSSIEGMCPDVKNYFNKEFMIL